MEINSNNGLLIESSLDTPSFTITTSRGAKMQVVFEDALTEKSDLFKSFGYELNEDVVCNVVVSNGIVTMTFSKNNKSQTNIKIKLFGFILDKKNKTSGFIGGTAIDVKSLDGDKITLSDNSLSILMKGIESRCLISVKPHMQMLSEPMFSMMSTPPFSAVYNVAEGSKPPEFALGIYDESTFSRPRPTRFGIPVISTVPTEPPYATTTAPPALTTDELTCYNSGLGPTSRTMWFKAFCNTQLPATGANAVPVSLMIYMPNGTDTISAPIEIPMTTSDSGWTYTGSAVFNQEDTINFVDGFCYFNVYIPLHMQVSLPLRLTLGYPQNNSSLITMFSVKEQKKTRKPKAKRL